MELLAGWVVCGAIASVWLMAAMTFNMQGWADFVGKLIANRPLEYKKYIIAAMAILYFVLGPLALADILRSAYISVRENSRKGK